MLFPRSLRNVLCRFTNDFELPDYPILNQIVLIKMFFLNPL